MTERTEYTRFTPDNTYLVDGDDLNVAWKASCILCAGDISRLSPDQRRDLGQQIQAALLRAEAVK